MYTIRGPVDYSAPSGLPAGLAPADVAALVPQETIAVSDTAKRRRYVSGKRGAQARETRSALLKAVLELIALGQFRASSRQITDRACVHHGSINYHYGHESLFYRIVAREHWADVVPYVPFSVAGEVDMFAAIDMAQATVWAILVGDLEDFL